MLNFKHAGIKKLEPLCMAIINSNEKNNIIYNKGGTYQNLDRDSCPIFLGLKFSQVLFFWVGKFFSYFSGFHKIPAILWGLTNFVLFLWVLLFCITHLNRLNGAHSTEKHKIMAAFHIHSNFDRHCILSYSIFLGLNFGTFYFFGFEFGVILFFWVLEICSPTSIPVEEMLVCPLPLGFIILAMISVSKMKNSVYNLIGLEDSCICDHYLTEFFCQLRLLKTHFL